MKLTNQTLKEFEEIWRQENPGERVNKQQLLEMANNLLNIVETIYKPIPKEKICKYNQIIQNEKRG